MDDEPVVHGRWQEMLAHEARIIGRQRPGFRIHSGFRPI
jgi:hypothetical protein